jgi:hypothetical protein
MLFLLVVLLRTLFLGHRVSPLMCVFCAYLAAI